ncbi:MAG: ABC transporter ATP-binding protein [Candidatus Nezhaarchaeales archaeon]|nr:MAG: ABC transporter ATP-binding protein [Candidatus Nezhaarchaeota archaeon WYZ-LMO8]TDA37082.1 MAG: ABC transporter ATP-binding protein [Candidatus Nezhaarchaeota archaeon WYZ-LMO7]
MSLLDVQKLMLYYKTSRGTLRAVDGVSFSLGKGETLGLVGESGSGKSSTAIAIMRLLPRNVELYDGRILLNGVDISKLSEKDFREKIRWKKISMVPQGAMSSFNPVLKIGFQVAEPLMVHQNMRKPETLKKVRELFKLVGMPPDYVDRYPHELSGGMRQRAAIAMALILNPDIVILDEPTSALDVSIQAQIMNLLKNLKKELGLSMIFITHDIALASDICDKIGVMYAGQIVELSSSENVLLNPRHPYTQKLIASIPRLREEKMPEFIPGAPPDLVSPPSGCRFHPRCPYSDGMKCVKEEPEMIEVEDDHFVKCWLHSGGSK